MNKFTPASAPLILASITASSSPSSGGGGLSTGAEAGIGVGIAVVCLALIALLVGLLIMRKRRRQRERSQWESAEMTHNPKSSMSPPPGYDSRSRGTSSDIVSHAEKRVNEPTSPRRPVSSGFSRTVSELEDTPRTARFSGSELDSAPVFEAQSREISRPKGHGMASEELGGLGLAPMSPAGRSRVGSGGIRGSTNATSSYSPISPSEGTLDASQQPFNMAGRWADFHTDGGYSPVR